MTQFQFLSFCFMVALECQTFSFLRNFCSYLFDFFLFGSIYYYFSFIFTKVITNLFNMKNLIKTKTCSLKKYHDPRLSFLLFNGCRLRNGTYGPLI